MSACLAAMNTEDSLIQCSLPAGHSDSHAFKRTISTTEYLRLFGEKRAEYMRLLETLPLKKREREDLLSGFADGLRTGLLAAFKVR